MWSDNETDTDLLGVDRLVDTLVFGVFCISPQKGVLSEIVCAPVGSPRSALSRGGSFGRFLHRHDRALG